MGVLQLGFSQAGSKVAPPTTTAGADNCLLALFSAHTGHFIVLSDTVLEKTSSSNICPQCAHL